MALQRLEPLSQNVPQPCVENATMEERGNLRLGQGDMSHTLRLHAHIGSLQFWKPDV